MLINKVTDIGFTKGGDFELSSNHDLVAKQGVNGIKQAIYMRLKTELLGCKLYPDMGHNFKSMYGKRTTRKNIAKVKNIFTQALTFGGLFDIIKVEVVPIQESALLLTATVKMDMLIYSFTCDFDFQDSLLSEIQFEMI
jgi:hypothetical protein